MPIDSASSSLLSTGLQGLQRAQQSAQRSAQEIAQAGAPAPEQTSAPNAVPEAGQNPPVAPTTDVVEPLINLRRQEQLFTASAQIVKTADQTLGSLLDVKA